MADLRDRLPAGVRIYQGSLIVERTVPNGLVTILPPPCTTGTPGEPLDKMVCGLGTIPVGQSVFINFQVVTDAGIPAGTVLENDATATSDNFDPDNTDNYAFTRAYLAEGHKDDEGAQAVRKKLRRSLPVQPGVSYDLGGDEQQEGPSRLRVNLFGDPGPRLDELANEVKRRISVIEGLTDAKVGGGERGAKEIEVSVDRGASWSDAHIEEPREKWLWARWSYLWEVDRPGSYQIMARATDETGRVQPQTPWNFQRKHFDWIVPTDVTVV